MRSGDGDGVVGGDEMYKQIFISLLLFFLFSFRSPGMIYFILLLPFKFF